MSDVQKEYREALYEREKCIAELAQAKVDAAALVRRAQENLSTARKVARRAYAKVFRLTYQPLCNCCGARHECAKEDGSKEEALSK